MSKKWPKWNEPNESEILQMTKILIPYIRFINPKIVEKIVLDNELNKEKWNNALNEKKINSGIYLWEKSPCVFPGIRRHSGNSESNKFKKRDFTDINNAVELDDNTYPKELWSWVLRDSKKYDRTNPENYQLAHIFDHKDYKTKNVDELEGEINSSDFMFSGLYTSATNNCFVPTVFLKPTDHNSKLRKLLQRFQYDMYSNVCNILPYGLTVKHSIDEWNIDDFEKPQIVGSMDHLDDFLRYRNAIINNYLGLQTSGLK